MNKDQIKGGLKEATGEVQEHVGRMAVTFAARADGESVEAIIGKLKARIG